MTDDVTVKVSTQHPAWPLLRQTPGGTGVWEEFRFVVNEPVESCDFWVVCDGLQHVETTACPPGNTLLITWEPPTGVRPPYATKFISQFGHLLTCHPRVRHPRAVRGQQGHPWFVGRSYDELLAPPSTEKPVPLVIITSNSTLTEGHRRRLRFAREVAGYFGKDAQLVGRGFADFEDKWDVLSPARFSLVVENAVLDDWLTEKLPDSLLAGAIPFYAGAPNAHQYFPAKSYVPIDLRDPASAIRRIEQAMGDDERWGSYQEPLTSAREKYLAELQLFPVMARMIRSRRSQAPATQITLRPEDHLVSPASRQLRRVTRAVRARTSR